MSKPKNWAMISRKNKKDEEEFRDFLGEPLGGFTISEEGLEEYRSLYSVCSELNKDILYGSKEIEYRKELSRRLRDLEYNVIEEHTYYQDISGSLYCPRVDLSVRNKNGEYVIELKIDKRMKYFLQVAEYIVASELDVGYLICFLKTRVEVFMILRISDKLYCYTNGNLYLLPLELL